MTKKKSKITPLKEFGGRFLEALPLLSPIAAGILGVILAHCQYGLSRPFQGRGDSVLVGILTFLTELGVAMLIYHQGDRSRKDVGDGKPDWTWTIIVNLLISAFVIISAYMVLIPFFSWFIPFSQILTFIPE